MSSNEPKDVSALMRDGTLIGNALRQSWINVLVRHKKLGYPIVVWSDGKVVQIPAEEIQIPEPDAENRSI
jgi:hypothetical protein